MNGKTKKIIQWTAGVIFSLLIIFVILISSFEIVLYSDMSVYRKEYEKYEVLDELDMTMDDAMYVTREMMDYLRGDKETLSVITEVEGKRQDFFNEQDRFHMREVRDIFAGGLRLRTAALVAAAVSLLILYMCRADVKKILPQTYQVAVGIVLIPTAGIGIAAAIDFNSVFVQFHNIFFDNDLWLFDPAEDFMIRMLPEGLFYDMAFRVGSLFAGILVILFLLSLYMRWRENSRKVKEKTGIPLITLHHGQIYLPYSSLFSIVCIKQGFNIRKALFPLYYLYVLVRECLHHKKNIRICDAYVVLSSSFQRQLGSSSKIQAIGNPLSYSSFFDMSQYDKKENVVVMVGRISEFHKRFSLALKIWQKIETNPAFSSWNFEIVGDGSDLAIVKKMISELGLQRVIMTGYANPEPYYKRAKISFMTSAFEGFPLVLLEAAQNGCVPIVMDSFEAVHDIVDDKVNGLIVPNGNVEVFASEVEVLMNDSDRLFSMATSAIEKSHQYEPLELINKWLNLFNKLNLR